MTPQQLKAMKLALEALEYLGTMHFQHTGEALYQETFTAIEDALSEHAMQETQRLGQEIEATKRKWVGLTDEDMYVVSEEESCSFIAGAKWAEAILKEKNQ